MKILFLVPYPNEGASNRIRVEQYMPYLKEKGLVCRIRPFMNSALYSISYMPHRYLKKIFWFIVCTANRAFDIFRAFGYEVIFIHREAYPFGGPFFESIFRRMGKAIIFDFDDAIFLPNTSEHNTYIERFKRPDKVAKIIAMSAMVMAGNEYLKGYALKYNKDVVVIPSSIDTDKYRPAAFRNNNKETVIGWIGSNTTKGFLYCIEDVLMELSKRYSDLVIKVVGANFYSARLKNIVNKKWLLSEEIDDLRSFDVGITPMPDNEWTKGKCGFKTILYMACGIPVVVSPVGVNTEIVDEGLNGYLAASREKWLESLSRLIENKELRERMGRMGREKVVDKYSITAAAPIFHKALMKTTKGARNG